MAKKKKEWITIELKHSPLNVVEKRRGKKIKVHGISYRNPNGGDCFDLGIECGPTTPDIEDYGGEGVILCINGTWHLCIDGPLN